MADRARRELGDSGKHGVLSRIGQGGGWWLALVVACAVGLGRAGFGFLGRPHPEPAAGRWHQPCDAGRSYSVDCHPERPPVAESRAGRPEQHPAARANARAVPQAIAPARAVSVFGTE